MTEREIDDRILSCVVYGGLIALFVGTLMVRATGDRIATAIIGAFLSFCFAIGGLLVMIDPGDGGPMRRLFARLSLASQGAVFALWFLPLVRARLDSELLPWISGGLIGAFVLARLAVSLEEDRPLVPPAPARPRSRPRSRPRIRLRLRLKLKARPRVKEARCAYCHDDEPAGEGLLACPRCETRLHRACWSELSACPSLGCEVRPEEALRRGERRFSRRWRAARSARPR